MELEIRNGIRMIVNKDAEVVTKLCFAMLKEVFKCTVTDEYILNMGWTITLTYYLPNNLTGYLSTKFSDITKR